MADQFRTILSDFLASYQACPDNFQQLVRIAFEKSKEVSDRSGIDRMFFYILREGREWTVQQVKIMIELGADPRYSEDVPLQVAAGYSTCDVAEYLIDNHGAKIDSENICTAFMRTGTPSTLRMLLDKNFRINDSDIMFLVHRMDLIEVLLEKGFDINLILAKIAFLNPNSCDKRIYPFVINAIKNENLITLDNDTLIKLFLFVINSGQLTLADAQVFFSTGINPRHNNDQFFVELCKCHTLIPKYFINEYGADVNAHDGLALANALSADNGSIIKMLLELGATITENHITIALNNHENLDRLNRYGNISKELIAKMLMVKLFDKANKQDRVLAKLLVMDEVDFNDVIWDLK